MNDEPLLPCPFCGGLAESDRAQGFRRIVDGEYRNQAAVYCTECSANMTMCWEEHPEYGPDDLVTILSDAWNNRTPNDPDQRPGESPKTL